MEPSAKPRIAASGIVRPATADFSPELSSTNGFDASASSLISERIGRDELLRMYRLMLLIRKFEETCGEHYSRGNIRGFLHLYVGQEATGIGAITPLKDRDYIVTHYRDHGHALARGLDTNRIMAEMFGKRTGLSKGKGGSMHIFDAAKRFMGGHAIVGAQLPLAAGIALAQQYMDTDVVTMVFFGDGATNQGTFHETMNLASVWQLPIIFFMENNLYGMGSAVGRVRLRGSDFSDAMGAYDIDTVAVDGMDVVAVREATQTAVDNIRAHGSPIFIEAKTFRFVGHSFADPGDQYRERAEIDRWRRRDPLTTYPKQLLDHGVATESELDDLVASVDAEIQFAVEFAANSPDPELSEAYDDVYA
jgi:pyruvate dehydrogenase E1 component alpha subunit